MRMKAEDLYRLVDVAPQNECAKAEKMLTGKKCRFPNKVKDGFSFRKSIRDNGGDQHKAE